MPILNPLFEFKRKPPKREILRGGGVLIASVANFNPASLFGAGEQGVVYDLTDSTTVFQERTGAAATTPSGANGPIGTVKDLSPNNNYCIAPSDPARSTWRSAGYAQADGTDDTMVSTFTFAQPFTRVCCWRLILRAGGFNCVMDGSLTGRGEAYIDGVGPFNFKMFNSSEFVVSNAILENVDYVTTERFSGGSSSGKINNGSYVLGSLGSAPAGGIRYFAENGSGGFTQLRLYRTVAINRILTDPEIASCVTWCGAAAGLIL